MDKRKTFFKTLDKIGTVENFAALSADDRDWVERAEVAARTAIRERKKDISEEALAELVSRVGPNARQLENEIEKLCVFTGDRKKIEFADVAAYLRPEQNRPGLCAGRRAGRPRFADLFMRNPKAKQGHSTAMYATLGA